MASDDPTRGGGPSAEAPPFADARYKAVREIGRGGMGSVLEATDPVLGRVVAVKHALGDDAGVVARFDREIRITARLEHPSIVPVYDAGETAEGVPFYVMRRLAGRPLDEVIAERAEQGDRLGLLPNVLAAVQAVAHAHQRGVIHRDLKPANIVVGTLGETFVIDWGLARTVDESEPSHPAVADDGDERWVRTRAGVVMGTPGYMAPEQQRTSDVDKRADVYSLGATLQTVLTAQPPSSGAVPASVPLALAAIVAKATAEAPGDRYADAGELADELQRFLTGRLVSAHRYTRIERLARFARRHRAALVVAAAALAILAIGSFFAIDRILVSRDTAVRERALATARAEALLLEQARLLIPTEPTRAAAMARTLVDSARWRSARAIISAARMVGVPWQFPARAPTWIGVASDGRHAVLVDRDGVHLLDLRDRAKRSLPDVAGTRFALCDRFVAAGGTTLAIVELPTGARTQVPLAHPLASIGCAADVVFGIYETGIAWQLRTGDRAPKPFAITELVTELVASADGSRFAIAGASRVWQADAAGKLDPLLEGKARALAIAPDGRTVVAVVGDDVVTASDLGHGTPPAVSSRAVFGTMRVAATRDVVYQGGLSGLEYRADLGDRIVTRTLATGARLWPLHHARDSLVVTWTGSTLEVLDATTHTASSAPVHVSRVPSPLGPIEQVATSPRGSFVAAIAASSVLVWDLDDVIARRLPYPRTGIVRLAPVLGRAAFAQGPSDSVVRIELASGRMAVAELHGPLRVDSAGETSIAIDDRNQVWRIRDREPPELVAPGPIALAQLVDHATAAVVTMTGELQVVDLATRRTHRLAGPATKPDALAAGPGWIVTRRARELTRIAIATGAATTLSDAGAFSTPSADGGVVLVRAGEIVRWTADQRVVPLARIPEAISSIVQLDAGRAWVSGDHVYEVSATSATAPIPVAATTPLRSLRTSDGQVVTYVDGGDPMVFDTETGVRWRAAGAPEAVEGPYVSGDGSLLFAVIDGEIWVWRMGRPATAVETARWADAATNARWDAGSSRLDWR